MEENLDLLKQEETAEETVDTAEEIAEEAVDMAEETTAEAAEPARDANAPKTEEELRAENEAICDEALTTEKFCVTFMMRFRDLAKFNLRYTLLNLSSVLFWLALVLCIVWLVFEWSALDGQKRALLICFLVILIWGYPVRAIINAAKSANYLRTQSTPTEYHACEEGFVVVQEGQRGLLKYSSITRVKEHGSTLYAYVFRNSGFIFPKDLVGDHYDDIKALLAAKVKK
ncbi:MAG: YcxB family protein [Lachnospiraceae bacterium]|nr:YcxB family protein [Lachnospiraceae bacterium]